MAVITLVVCVEWFPGERQVGFAEGLVLRRVGVDEGGDVLGVGLPADDELRLADLLHDKERLGEWMQAVPDFEAYEAGSEQKVRKVPR